MKIETGSIKQNVRGGHDTDLGVGFCLNFSPVVLGRRSHFSVVGLLAAHVDVGWLAHVLVGLVASTSTS